MEKKANELLFYYNINVRVGFSNLGNDKFASFVRQFISICSRRWALMQSRNEEDMGDQVNG